MNSAEAAPPAKKPLYRQLYAQVLFAIALGVVVGMAFPGFATTPGVEALGAGFIKLIKMVIAPIIFCTVSTGIAHIQDARKVGRVGVKALVYFEIVSTFALAIGLIVGNVVQPGAGFGGHADAAAVAKFSKEHLSTVDFLVNIIPISVVGAFARGDILQVLLFSILMGFAMMAMGERAASLRRLIDEVAMAMFGVIGIVMKAAPLGAFGAMAFTVGKYRPDRAGQPVRPDRDLLLHLGAVHLPGVGAYRALHRLLDPEFLALYQGRTADRARHLVVGKRLAAIDGQAGASGCSRSVVGLVVPTGYSFNLDGTNIYMTLATLFIAQALNIPLTCSSS